MLCTKSLEELGYLGSLILELEIQSHLSFLLAFLSLKKFIVPAFSATQ